ncbi:MAG: type I-D CRISPR-associated protein Cas10d/Csc3 [Stenomitos frigidus ULC029]
MLVYILNSLLAAWNLLPFLSRKLALSDDEKRLLCLGFTFQNCTNFHQNEMAISLLIPDSPLGEALALDTFWAEWREYLPELVSFSQTTHQLERKSTTSARKTTGNIPEHRLKLPLCQLLSYGTIAAQLTDPADIMTKPEGDRLRKDLQELGIDRTLIYHRLRNGIGLLTNSIHNAVLHFAGKLNWQPLLFFAQGVVYLAPSESGLPDRFALQTSVWEQVSNELVPKLIMGESGFKRDGKGLKASPQSLELIPPAQLIRNLPNIVTATIKNGNDPVTPKRLARLNLSPAEREYVSHGADLRSDRVAEFIIFLQKEFFGTNAEFLVWVLAQLGIQTAVTPAQTQITLGGVRWGWYYAAAYYIASNPMLTLEDVTEKLQKLANQLATWAEAKHLLLAQISLTREVLYDYLAQYLELPGWDNPVPSFQHELATYMAAKTQAAQQPICSLSSGEFASEDQMDAAVLFKAQQYSNKNSLGGRQLKRGISKLWSLEMLLRQAFWSVPAGKLEEQQPVFLYLFPTFVHAPQVTKVLRLLVNQLKRVNLWEVRRFWQEHGMDSNTLRFYSWLRTATNPTEEDKADLPFLAMTYTVTKGKTMTDAWVEPAFLALVLPLMLGIQVVATASSVPPHNSGREFSATVQMDGPVSFWNLLGFPTSIHLEEVAQGQVKHLNDWLDRLLVAYSIHLDCQARRPDPRWQSFPDTVQAITTDISAIFSLAHSHFQSLSNEKVQQYWRFAEIWAAGDSVMEQQLELTQRLVQEYRTFYRVHVAKSTHAIVLPLSKVLENILSTPSDVPIETLILQTSGRLHDALRRQEPYKRTLIMDKSLSIEVRVTNEIQAIRQFVSTCINDLFLGQYKGDRALLQEHRNRIKSGAEFAYRLLAMQEKPKT